MDGMVMTMLGWRRAGRRAVLHGRMLDRRLRQLRDLLLDLDETPEFARQEVDRSEIVLLRPQADFSDPYRGPNERRGDRHAPSPPVGLAVRRLTADTSADRQAWERYCSGTAYTLTMFSRLDCSKYSQHSQQLWELDWLIAEYSERIGDQRHVLSRLADHIGEAEVIQKFLEDLLSTQKFYLEERERLLVQTRA
jgi:hypothetical protein